MKDEFQRTFNEAGLLNKAAKILRSSDSSQKQKYQILKELEAHKVIFDIFQELNNITDFQIFSQNFSLFIKNQIDASSISLFLVSNFNHSILQPYIGNGIDIDILLKRNQNFYESDYLYHFLKEKKQVISLLSIEKSFLSTGELEILQSSNANLLLPIIHSDKLLGIFLIGDCQNSTGYIYDDIYFLNLIPFFFGSIYYKLIKSIDTDYNYKSLSNKQLLQDSVFSLIEDIASLENLDQFYNKLHIILNKLSIEKYIIFYDSGVDNSYHLKVNLINSVYKNKLTISKFSSLVSHIKKNQSFIQNHKLGDCHEIQELFYGEVADEQVKIIPFNFNEELLGFLLIKEKDASSLKVNESFLYNLSKIVAQYLNSFLYHRKVEILSKNPFFIIESYLDRNFSQVKASDKFCCFAVFKIKNIHRMINLKGREFFLLYEQKLESIINSHLNECEDNYFKLSYGKFLFIFTNEDEFGSDRVVKQIINSFNETGHINSDFPILLSYRYFNYPVDEILSTKERILEEVEDF